MTAPLRPLQPRRAQSTAQPGQAPAAPGAAQAGGQYMRPPNTFAGMAQRGMPRPPRPTTQPSFGGFAAGAPAPGQAPQQPQQPRMPQPSQPPNAQQNPSVPRTFTPQASPYQPQIQRGVQQLLAQPSAYSTDVVQGTYNVLDRQITNAGRTAGNQIDDTMAARGLRVSTPARTAQGDLAVELDRNRRDAAQMLVDTQARDLTTARNSAIQTALGADRQQQEGDLAAFGANEEAIDRAYGRGLAGREMGLQEELGRGELQLGRDRFAGEMSNATADRGLRERLGIGGLDMDYARLMQGDAQFGATYGEGQRQFNAGDYREGQRIGISRDAADASFYRDAAGLFAQVAGIPGLAGRLGLPAPGSTPAGTPPAPPPPTYDETDTRQPSTQGGLRSVAPSGPRLNSVSSMAAPQTGSDGLPGDRFSGIGSGMQLPPTQVPLASPTAGAGAYNAGQPYRSPLTGFVPSWRGGTGGLSLPGLPSGMGGAIGLPAPAPSVPGAPAQPGEYRWGQPYGGPTQPTGPVQTPRGQGNLWTPPGAGQSQGPDRGFAQQLQQMEQRFAVTPENQYDVIPRTGDFDADWEAQRAGRSFDEEADGYVTPGYRQRRFFAPQDAALEADAYERTLGTNGTDAMRAYAASQGVDDRYATEADYARLQADPEYQRLARGDAQRQVADYRTLRVPN